jgi:hypothetical protein
MSSGGERTFLENHFKTMVSVDFFTVHHSLSGAVRIAAPGSRPSLDFFISP